MPRERLMRFNPGYLVSPVDSIYQMCQYVYMAKRQEPSFTLTARVSQETYEACWRASDKAGIGISTWVRQLVQAALDRETEKEAAGTR
jgi:predicted HicB family RNase H-like nuclease